MDFWTDLNRLYVRLFTLSSLITILTCFSISMAQAPTCIPNPTEPQELEQAEQAERQPTSLAGADAAIINDIMEIRKSLGGGLSETFNRDSLTQMGLGSLETEFASGFKSALEEVATQGPTATGGKLQDPSVSNETEKGTSIDEILPASGKLAANWDAGLPSQLGGFDIAKSEAVKIAAAGAAEPTFSKAYTKREKQDLRDVARKLDQLAADLEDIEQFSFADQLRDSAGQMRTHARTPFTAEDLSGDEKTLLR